VDFYRKLELELLYGGEHATFTSFRAGEGFSIKAVCRFISLFNWYVSQVYQMMTTPVSVMATDSAFVNSRIESKTIRNRNTTVHKTGIR